MKHLIKIINQAILELQNGQKGVKKILTLFWSSWSSKMAGLMILIKCFTFQAILEIQGRKEVH